MENIKKNLSKNLLELRKQKKLTQLELATQLNYSDKSISKWEHGDAVPDIAVLKQLASFYGVTVDYLISDEKEQNSLEKTSVDPSKNKNRFIITMLATSVVWIVATVVFVGLKIALDISFWLAYIWALPASFIVLIVFNAIWRRKKFSIILTSALIWTLLLAIYLQCLAFNVWVIFLIGAPLQIAVILWSQLKKTKKH